MTAEGALVIEPTKNNTGIHEVHRYPGLLIVVEGIDGSGKSTQVRLLQRHLDALGFSVLFTEWNSSQLVRETLREGKRKQLLTPSTFSLLHAVDFADRYYYEILPALKAGRIVLCDRYVFTAFARDAARGVDPGWVRNLYSFAARPDLSLYFRVPIEVSVERLLSSRTKIKYYEAGMDTGLAANLLESFALFQGKVLQEYDRIAAEFGIQVIDAAEAIQTQQGRVREMTAQVLKTKSLRKVVAP